MKFFWPDITNTHDAHKACSGASGVAFFIALVTGGVIAAQTAGKLEGFPELGKSAYIDVALFVIIGIGLLFHSRLAAVAGLLLFFFERVFMIYTAGFQAGQIFGILLFGIVFVNGVRGAFAWHELRKAELAAASSDPVPMQAPPAPVVVAHKTSWIRPLILTVILITLAMGAFYYIKTNKEASELYGKLNQKNKQMMRNALPKAVQKPMKAPEGPAISLTLKSGRKFQGILIKKNAEGYWLYIEGTGEVFFSPGEVASESQG